MKIFKSLTAAAGLVAIVMALQGNGCFGGNDVTGVNSPNPTPAPTAVANKCTNGSCYIRSANVCCPNGYLYFSGTRCYETLAACQSSQTGGSSKCYYETYCIP
jgi:hypothetical protein